MVEAVSQIFQALFFQKKSRKRFKNVKSFDSKKLIVKKKLKFSDQMAAAKRYGIQMKILKNFEAIYEL